MAHGPPPALCGSFKNLTLNLPGVLTMPLFKLRWLAVVGLLCPGAAYQPALQRRRALCLARDAALALTFPIQCVAATEDDRSIAVTEDEIAAERQRSAEERQRLIAKRRAQMELSRSSSDRQIYFDLSKQRAERVYNTTYQGANCIPGIPCI